MLSDDNIADLALPTVPNVAVDAVFDFLFNRIVRGDEDANPEINDPVFVIPGTSVTEDVDIPSIRFCTPISSFVCTT